MARGKPLIRSRMFSLGAFIFVMLNSSNRGISQSLSGANLPASGSVMAKTFRPFSSWGIDSHGGIGGIGFDVATPLSRDFNVRAGSDFFGYSATFQEQGANIAANLRLRSGHASLDWFPFGGRFRLSPQVVFANNNRVQATALIPPGNKITLTDKITSAVLLTLCSEAGRSIFARLRPALHLGLEILSRAPEVTSASR